MTINMAGLIVLQRVSSGLYVYSLLPGCSEKNQIKLLFWANVVVALTMVFVLYMMWQATP